MEEMLDVACARHAELEKAVADREKEIANLRSEMEKLDTFLKLAQEIFHPDAIDTPRAKATPEMPAQAAEKRPQRPMPARPVQVS